MGRDANFTNFHEYLRKYCQPQKNAESANEFKTVKYTNKRRAKHHKTRNRRFDGSKAVLKPTHSRR